MPVNIVQIGEYIFLCDVRILFQNLVVHSIINQIRLPPRVFRTQVINCGLASYVQTLFRLQTGNLRPADGFLEDFCFGFQRSHVIRRQDELEVLLQLGVLQRDVQPRIEVGDDAQGHLLFVQVRQQPQSAVALLPVRRSFVDVDQMGREGVQFFVVSVEVRVLEGALYDQLPPLLPAQAGLQPEVGVFLVEAVPGLLEVGHEHVVVAEHAVQGANFAVLFSGRRSELQQRVGHAERDQLQARRAHFQVFWCTAGISPFSTHVISCSDNKQQGLKFGSNDARLFLLLLKVKYTL